MSTLPTTTGSLYFKEGMERKLQMSEIAWQLLKLEVTEPFCSFWISSAYLHGCIIVVLGCTLPSTFMMRPMASQVIHYRQCTRIEV